MTDRVLLVGGERVDLGGRAFDLLLALLERCDRVVCKDELLNAVWSGLVVEDNNLQVQISALRKALGPRAIATVPGRGYKFALEVASTVVPALPPRADEHPTPRHLLPPIHGREDDLAALSVLVAQHRLVTIVGAGGMGKTTLARHLTQAQSESEGFEVAWVELEAIADGELIVGSFAATLSIGTDSKSSLARLFGAIQSIALLVVFDNAEHLVSAVAAFASQLLRACPRVRVLVTSQIPLRLEAEHVYRLAGLAVPESGEVIATLGEAMTFGAIALFVDRASSADQRFALTHENLPMVGDICRHLDGMALAIELAAARVPLLGIARLQAALEDRLRVLTTGRSGAPPRLQTLRATLDWSVGLLNPIERATFRRLGVFAGGFSLELAQQIAAGPAPEGPLDEWAVVDALGVLVERSLVSADRSNVPRYSLLESARIFARELLAAVGEKGEWERKHATVICAAFLGGTRPQGQRQPGGADPPWQLESELENAHAALNWAVRNEPDLAAMLAPVMATVLTSARQGEQRIVWERTAPVVDLAPSVAARASWFRGAGRAHCLDVETRLKSAQAYLELQRGLRDNDGVFDGICLVMVNGLLLGSSEFESLYAELKELGWHARPSVNPLHALQAQLAYFAVRGDWHEFETVNDQILAQAILTGDEYSKHIAQINAVEASLAAGRTDESVTRGRIVLDEIATSKNRWMVSAARQMLARALVLQGSAAEARQQALLGAADARRCGWDHTWADVLAGLAGLEERPRTAAMLCGLADSLYTRRSERRQVTDMRLRAFAEANSAKAIGTLAFEALCIEGKGRDFEACLREALNTCDLGSHPSP